MANPFGELVDDDMLDETTTYVGQPKTQKDRAREAMRLISDEGKNSDAASYVQSVKAHYGDGVSALCVVYNGTGDTLHYVTDHDWFGYIGRTPYPVEIGNGQWAAFLHVHRTGHPSGSEAAVVYRGKNRDGHDRDFLIAWNVPWSWSKNTVYSKVDTVNYFQTRWNHIYTELNNGSKTHNTDGDGCRIHVDIGSGTSPVFRAELSIPYNP